MDGRAGRRAAAGTVRSRARWVCWTVRLRCHPSGLCCELSSTASTKSSTLDQRPHAPTREAAATESSSSFPNRKLSAVLCTLSYSSALRGLVMPRRTPARAQSSAYCTAGSAVARVLMSSMMSGSTRVERETSLLSAEAPRIRTTRVVSERALTKVVCSCGTKGLSRIADFEMRRERVWRMAALTPHGNRSPTMRISGPVIWMTNGLRVAKGVREMTAPRADADASRSSGVPVIRPCK
mmetsp:Transcript_28860/g.65400  ORF Transcript_28860/g.65400 Transcript_28860/m.65400 type:complete len:238 (-) Transcript_28860:268-981(-)